MRDLLERSRTARLMVALAAGCCVMALAKAAAARNDLDMREVFRAPPPAAEPAAPPRASADAGDRRRPVAAPPSRVALPRPRREDRLVAERRRHAVVVAARPAPLVIHMAALPPSRAGLFDAVPQKPAIVSIYEDQTLRRGDAVMMRDGLRVFRGREAGPHHPADFIRLTRAPSLDWHLRNTLSAFDNNPPDHWRS